MHQDESHALTVRLARPDDAPAIAAIYNQGIEERIATFEIHPRSAEQIVAILRERGNAYPTVVAERGGGMIAWAGASPYSSRTCYAGVAELSIYTDREARGSGVGRAVLLRLCRECEERGFWKLVSRVFPENVASRRLCESLGFREVGIYRRHAKLDGLWKDTVIVEKLLGEAAGGEGPREQV
jgi:L-amino acid N-acyltransferase YncA